MKPRAEHGADISDRNSETDRAAVTRTTVKSPVAVGRPFLRIAEHELDDHPYAEWRGWYFVCRRPDGTAIAAHPAPGQGLHGSQRMAYKAAMQHLRDGGCPLDTGSAR